MADTIGRITVPTPVASGLTFPLRPDFGCGMARPWPVITHRFGEYATKSEQRFQVGVGPRKFPFPIQRLNYAQRATIFAFYEEVQGSFQSFLYNAPQPDGTFVQYTVIFEAKPLTVNESPNGSSVVTFNLIEVPNAATAPEYSIESTCGRFPSSALSAALLSQVQQIIPLIHIRVHDTTVPDIYLSDRRVTIVDQSGGGLLYLPRVLDMGEPGTNILLSQNINGAAETVQFVFGNADGAMAALANDTDLKFASIDLCLYHVNSGILWQFWKGFIQQFIADGSSKFPVNCSDGLFQVMQMYPNRVASRNCWKTYNDGKYCPWATQGSSAAVVTTAGGDPTQCDFTWNGTWWLHLRRCAKCGHIGCCDSSPSQHASKHAAITGHPMIASFEPGEDWFYDYEKRGMIEGMELLPPHSHPEDQPSPGPAGRVPANWESLLH